MKEKPKEEKKSWIVKARCTVEKEIITKECTKEEAEKDPFSFVEDEQDSYIEEMEVLSVEENI
jgi:hypothetical protein